MPFDLSEEMVRLTEAELNGELPEFYRSRMKLSNGGSVEAEGEEWELIPIKDSSDRKRISRTCNHVISETVSFSEFDTWHELALAIAQNGMGDALVMFQNGNRFGPEIFHWYHEDGSLTLVASDFKDLPDA